MLETISGVIGLMCFIGLMGVAAYAFGTSLEELYLCRKERKKK